MKDPNQAKQLPVRSILKRDYKNYYAQNSNGEWVEVDRLTCVSYDPATAFTGKYPQRWYCDFESEYIVRLSRDKAGEQLYNAVKYLRRKDKKLYVEQLGCVGEDCPKCKGWEEVMDGEIKCERCPKRVVFVALDKEREDGDIVSRLEIDSGANVISQVESRYLLELLHKVLEAEFDSDERKLWRCLAVEMKKKDIALLFGWTLKKLEYRQKLLFDKLRANERLRKFVEIH